MVHPRNEVYIASASRTPKSMIRKTKKKSSSLLPPISSSGRTLTSQELEWATAIRTAVHEHNAETERDEGSAFTYDHMSDLEYAQHAIVSKNDVGKALRKIRKIQEFKRAHAAELGSSQCPTTAYHAIAMVESFMDAHPGVLISLGKISPGTTTVVGFCPLGLQQQQHQQLRSSRDPVDDSDKPLDFPIVLYFIFQALQTDLDEIRQGTVWIGDLEMDSPSSSSISSWVTFFKAAANLCRDAYPIRVTQVSLLRASPWVRTVLRMVTHVFSRKVQQVLDVDDAGGHQSQLIRQGMPASALPPFCGGTQRPSQVMNALRERLRKRYEMEESFQF